MTPFENLQIASVFEIFSVVDVWATIISQRCNLGQATEHIDFREGQRGLPYTPGLGGNRGTQLSK